MAVDEILSQVLALLVFDSDGARVAARYTPASQQFSVFKGFTNQRKFEKELLDKATKLTTGSLTAEILNLGGFLVFYRAAQECQVVVIGDPAESEILLNDVLNGLFHTLARICGAKLTRRMLMDKLDSVFIALEEIVDGSIIFEVDPTTIMQRIEMMPEDKKRESVSGATQDHAGAFNQAISQARDNLMRSFLSGV